MIKLKEIIDLENFEKVKAGYTPYLEIGDINVITKKYKIKDKPSVSGAYKVRKNDILVSTVRPTRGAITIINDDNMVASGAFARLRVTNNKFLTKYVYYVINTKKFFDYLGKNSTGSTYPTCSKDVVYEYEIPDLSLNEQKKYVEEIDNIEIMLGNKYEVIANLEELIYSKFDEMFKNKGFAKSTIGKECVLNPKKSELGSFLEDKKVSFVAMPSVSEKGEIDASVSREYLEVKKGFTYFRENDVLFAKITPCMENGKGAIAKNLINGVGFGSTEFHVIRCKQNLLPEWIFVITKSKEFRKEAESKMTGSAGQKRVPENFLNDYEIEVPPIELQKEYSDYYNEIINAIRNTKKTIAELQLLLSKKIGSIN